MLFYRFPSQKRRCTVVFILYLTASIRAESLGAFFKLRINSFLSDESTIWNGKAASLLSCSQKCARQASCKSASFMTSEGRCLLHDEKQTELSGILLQREDSFYLKKVKQAIYNTSATLPLTVTSFGAGTIQSSAISSCQALRSQIPLPSSGIYWIDPDGGSHTNAFKAYCDMDTNGGGWTLVWSYTFTDYEFFMAGTNAVTPRPNWPVRHKNEVPISTTPPMSETDYNAMDFSLWKQLGRQVLIKSNVNNWLICNPVTGSLVDWQEGSVSCQIVKRVTDKCLEASAPSSISPNERLRCGPVFLSTSFWVDGYYYFDGCTRKDWPIHDPCGITSAQWTYLQNVANPHGNIFVR